MGSLIASNSPAGLSNNVLLVAVPFPPDEKWMASLEARFPGFKVRWVTQEMKLPPPPLPDQAYEGVTMLCTLLPHPVERLQAVRYVQLLSAGADRWITHELYQKRDVVFCTANSVHA